MNINSIFESTTIPKVLQEIILSYNDGYCKYCHSFVKCIPNNSSICNICYNSSIYPISYISLRECLNRTCNNNIIHKEYIYIDITINNLFRHLIICYSCIIKNSSRICINCERSIIVINVKNKTITCQCGLFIKCNQARYNSINLLVDVMNSIKLYR
jgi:hypothetical protein